MNPTSLLSVPTELLREHARVGGSTDLPMASLDDRKWALVACVALVAVAALLIVVCR
ncbi:MAG TPA: hypothetical protein VIY30_04870 [Burkholderiaceae bacterium]